MSIRGFLRRRSTSFATGFLLVSVCSLVVAFMLPPLYQAVAVLQVEGKVLPGKGTDLAAAATGWLESTTQRVWSPSKLQEAAQDFDLYASRRDAPSGDVRGERLREAVEVAVTGVEVRRHLSTGDVETAITFTLAHTGSDPVAAGGVVNRLAEFLITEKPPPGPTRVSDPLAPLEAESVRLESLVSGHEERLAAFKESHLGELPEHSSVNLQMVERLSLDLEALKAEVSALRDRRSRQSERLARLDPTVMVAKPPTGMTSEQPGLGSSTGSLDGAPPASAASAAMGREDSAGTKATAPDASPVRHDQLEELKAQLVSLRRILGPRNPDVIRLSQQVETLSARIAPQRLKKEATDEPPPRLEQKPLDMVPAPNPAYLALEGELGETNEEIRSLDNRISNVQGKISEYKRRLDKGVEVEREYTALTRDYESAKRQSLEIQDRLIAARLELAREPFRTDPRFRVITAARQPPNPAGPDRLRLLINGLVMAVFVGIGGAALREWRNPSVTSAEQLGDLPGMPLLGVLPFVESQQERRRRWTRQAVWTVGGCLLIALGGLLTYQGVFPVDRLCAELQMRVAQILAL